MSQLERFGVSMDADLLRRFDQRIRRAGYTNRSEAIRDMVRDYLVREEWRAGKEEVVGTITIVYDHHTPQLSEKLNEIQHAHHGKVRCTTHVHLDERNCLEVIVVAGRSDAVRDIADSLISARGVKHGQLSATTTGSRL